MTQVTQPTATGEFTLRDDFQPASYEQWRELVERDLKGAPFDRKLVASTYEGIAIQPLYVAGEHGAEGSGFPGFQPFIRGTRVTDNLPGGWDIVGQHVEPVTARLVENITQDLTRGATSVEVQCDEIVRLAVDPTHAAARASVGRDGAALYSARDFDLLVKAADPISHRLSVQAGASSVGVAAQVIGALRRAKASVTDATLWFNVDPIGAAATGASLPDTLNEHLAAMSRLAAWTAENMPSARTVTVATAPYHDAGCHAAQDLGIALATAVAYLRAMERVGMDPKTAAGQMVFDFNIGCRLFLSIAKLRAARMLWARVLQACKGEADASTMHITARTARRALTTRDPWVNMLRNTICCFAGITGGADAFVAAPFDRELGAPDEFSRRVARNTQLLLKEESNLHRVIDPAGGSYFIESLTRELAQVAWAFFQSIEGQGGIVAVIESGWLHEQIDTVWAQREKNIATRRDPVTGVSEFPLLTERRPDKQPVDHRALHQDLLNRLAEAEKTPKGETLIPELIKAAQGTGQFQVIPFPVRRFAEPFERLRDACETAPERPKVFLANLGPIAQHTARAMWASNFFQAGGLRVVSNNGFDSAEAAADAFKESGASIAVICSSDTVYAAMVTEVAPALREAGATSIVLAGRGGEQEAEYRAAGVNRFIYLGCNVLGILRELLAEQGVQA